MIVFLVPGAVLALLVTALSWCRPMLAVCTLLVLILSNAPDIVVNEYGLPSIGPLIVPAVAALLLLRWAAGLEQLDFAAVYLLPAFVFFMAVALRIPWVLDGTAAVQYTIELAKNLLIMLVFVGFLTTERRLLAAVRSVAFTIGALAALSVLQYATNGFDTNWFGFANASLQHISGDLHGWRVSGPLPDPNFYAQRLLMCVPLAVVLVAIERHFALKVLAGLAALAILAAIVLTYSRGAFVGLLALALVYILTTRRRAFLLPALLLIAGLLIVASPAEVGDRLWAGVETGRLLLGSGDIGGDPAVIQRISVMRSALRMFAEHPLLGVGPDQFAATYISYALLHDLDLWAPPAAHSLYLELAAEQGLLGLILLAALIGAALATTLRTHRRLVRRKRWRSSALVRAIALALVAYFATAVFLHDAYPRFFWTFLALLIACRGAFSPLPAQEPVQAWSSKLQTKHILPVAARTLRRHVILILVGAFLLGSLAALQTFTSPERYRSEATLLYRFGREYFPVTPTEVRRNWGENVIISLDNALATEMHLLSSHAVALRALEQSSELVRAAVEAEATTPRGSSYALLDKVEITRVQNATLLRAAIEDEQPQIARVLLDVFIAAYLDYRATLFHANAITYFDEQREALLDEERRLTEALDGLRSEYRKLEKGNILTDWSPEDPVIEQPQEDLAETEQRLARLDAEIAFSEGRLADLQSRRAELAREQDEWRISRAYTEGVAPNVTVADRPPVRRVDSGKAKAAKVIAAALTGAILVWFVLVVAALIARRPAFSSSRPATTSQTPPTAEKQGPSISDLK